MNDYEIAEIQRTLAHHTQMLERLCAKVGIFAYTDPQPPALQEKWQRIGWTGEWFPTPGVSDEDKEIYLSLDSDVHLYAMPIEEALSLSDEEFSARMNVLLEDEQLKQQAIAEYERRRVK